MIILFILFIVLILIICFIISIYGTHQIFGGLTKAKSNKAKSNKAKSNKAKSNKAKSNNAKSNNAKSNNAKSKSNKAKSNKAKSNNAKSNKDKLDKDKLDAKSNEDKDTSNEAISTKYKLTYTISGGLNGGNLLDYSILRNILKNAESQYDFIFEERPISEDVHVSFGDYNVDSDNNYDIGFYEQRSAIKNILNKQNSFISKSQLFKTIKRLIPLGMKHIPNTFSIKYFETTILSSNNNNIFPVIIKKLHSSKQKGIKIITSKNEYYKAKKELGINHKNPAVVSKYITNPMTVDGKKFHLRVHFLLSIINGITRCIAHDELHIVTAEETYKKSDWLNPKIHISGGKYTYKRYNYPDDIDYLNNDNKLSDNDDKCLNNDNDKLSNCKKLIIKNMNECIKVVCMALSMSNVTNFEETSAGYNIYGADFIIDSNYNAYIIEINRRPGFGAPGFGFREKSEAELFTKRFSHDIFSFILHNTVYPFFGICRWNFYSYISSEFINNGSLSQFGNILTGKNKYLLIPYNSAYNDEIQKAKMFNFYNNINFKYLSKYCDKHNIFLISISREYSIQNEAIIGYIGLEMEENKLFLQIAIIEEYQKRGIATAMIAQLFEIYKARQFTRPGPDTIIIQTNNNILNYIAKKLNFEKNNKNQYERKIRDNKLYNKIKANNHKLIYKIINNTADDINNSDKYIHNILKNNMILSNSYMQFIHFAFVHFSDSNSHIQLKWVTGSKYNKLFIHQGAELKSVLNAKIYNTNKFKNWCISQNIDTSTIIDSNINDSNINNTYLINEKLMTLRCYLMIYIKGNGIIKCFSFNKKVITMSSNKYTIDEIDKNTHYSSTDKIYNWPNDFKSGELSDIANNNSIINTFIKNFFSILLKSDIKKYEESNSGFLTFAIDIKFCKKNSCYIPILQSVYDTSGIYKNNIIDDIFMKNYYEWVINTVVYPHFGLSSISTKPIFISMMENLKEESIYQNIDINIISKLHFIADWKDENSFVIEILYNEKHWKKLHFNKIDDIKVELKITQMDDKNIYLNAIFMIMDIIAAYFSPIEMSLMLTGEDTITHTISHKLDFFRTGDSFIRKCRI